ncbi:MAG: hypothetical protein MHMPM18_003983 [Marteilia pararefringens]
MADPTVQEVYKADLYSSVSPNKTFKTHIGEAQFTLLADLLPAYYCDFEYTISHAFIKQLAKDSGANYPVVLRQFFESICLPLDPTAGLTTIEVDLVCHNSTDADLNIKFRTENVTNFGKDSTCVDLRAADIVLRVVGSPGLGVVASGKLTSIPIPAPKVHWIKIPESK